MTTADRIIADLVNALDTIQRKALDGLNGSSPSPLDALNYINGLASQAMVNCKARQERNSDGYLVTKEAR